MADEKVLLEEKEELEKVSGVKGGAEGGGWRVERGRREEGEGRREEGGGEEGGWKVEGGRWRVEGGGWRLEKNVC
jgi:hypothetical protein